MSGQSLGRLPLYTNEEYSAFIDTFSPFGPLVPTNANGLDRSILVFTEVLYPLSYTSVIKQRALQKTCMQPALNTSRLTTSHLSGFRATARPLIKVYSLLQ